MGVDVRITFDRAATLARIKAANERALVDTANQALKDCNQYVPEDQGDLVRSSLSNSNTRPQDGEMVLRWATPYARYQYYGVAMQGQPPKTPTDRSLKYTKAGAKKLWCLHAKAAHGKEWKKVYEASLKRGMRNG